MEFVVLKLGNEVATGVRGSRGSGTKVRSAPTIQTTRAASSTVATALQNGEDGFLAMPVGLIAPVELASPDDVKRQRELRKEEKKAGSTWGIRALRVNDSPMTGKGVKVAVLDSGIDRDHPAFQGLNLTCMNFVDKDNPNDVTDNTGHGTHTAATVFGRDVDEIRIGVARGVTDVLIGKVIGKGASTATVMEGLLWAWKNDANVILMSLGFDIVGFRDELESIGIDDQPMTPREATSRALSELVRNVRVFDSLSTLMSNFGTPVVIAACGNESEREDTPATIIGASFPAAAKGFYSVSAVRRPDKEGQGYKVTSFANSDAMFAGPGQDILSAAASHLQQNGDPLIYMNGTSMAAPHVAGIAALWAQKLMEERSQDLNGKIVSKLMEKYEPVVKPKETDVAHGMPRAPQKDDD